MLDRFLRETRGERMQQALLRLAMLMEDTFRDAGILSDGIDHGSHLSPRQKQIPGAIQEFAPANMSLLNDTRHCNSSRSPYSNRRSVGKGRGQLFNESKMLRLFSSTLVSGLLFTAIIMGPAFVFTGALDWLRGWLVIGICILAGAVGGVYFLVTDPGLVHERATVPQTKTPADTLATLFILLVVIGFCTAAVYDSRQLKLLSLSPDISLAAGVVVFVIGIAIVVWTFRVNSFATTVVEVQEARDQRVIDTGPYSFIRHPMYFGAIWYFAGLALMLESPAAALAAIVTFPIAFLPRILVEENVLRRDLAGYADYQSRVRKRILPGVF